MKPFTAIFEIVEDNNCPLYNRGEAFRLTDRSFTCPENKEVCLILVREMTELLFVLMGESDQAKTSEKLYSCSGCTGLIKFRAVTGDHVAGTGSKEVPLESHEQELLDKIIDCPLFRTVPPDYLRKMLKCFREEKIFAGRSLIRKGEPNKDLFVILSGGFSVDDGPVNITLLGPGEICGEMSYFVGNVAAASVTATTDSIVVAIAGEFFSEIIEQSSELQLFMARLLAERLARANQARASDFDSCMQGRLKEMAPAELFQVLHMHQKTGVLTLHFGSDYANVSFREGCIINAVYGDLENQEAIFEILSEKEGVYSFKTGLTPQQMKAAEIGDFMMLLMEGVKRVDEEHDFL
ncbi:MAG: hypothetical protein CR981_04785 [Proteobacteria bacterium]|nr:MAG: hypothetical protein CR981_04785 [Pseudomonadota bacterium]PIE65301.1 MAG: hypothetical protein CSA26_04325 [Desulfobacterales bacterium]